VEFPTQGLVRSREKTVLIKAGIGVQVRDERVAVMAVIKNDAFEQLRVGHEPVQVFLHAPPALRAQQFSVALMGRQQDARFAEPLARHPGGVGE